VGLHARSAGAVGARTGTASDFCVRGVYNAALGDKQRQLLAMLRTVDVDAPIDWGGTPFSFALFTWEFVQHESIHHGQWSIYASLAGFDTPLSWRTSWGL
jgi:hypothetical protein